MAGLSEEIPSDSGTLNRGSVHTYFLAFPVEAFERNDAIDLGKESEILAQPHIRPGMDTGPVLPDQNGTGMDHLSPISLHSQSLAGAVPAVPGTSLSFLVCHGNLLKPFGMPEMRLNASNALNEKQLI
jgi:hypothetical protein